MSKEQIEEMAKIICDGCAVNKDHCAFISQSKLCPTVLSDCENLYNAGYRKQSVGKWEKRVFVIFDSEKVGYRCSECNTTWDTETPYCPNCGAKMRKEDEGK